MSAVEVLIRAPGQQTRHGLRDTTMILLLFDASARIQEALDLTLADATTAAGSGQVTPTGKDRKHPHCPSWTNRTASGKVPGPLPPWRP